MILKNDDISMQNMNKRLTLVLSFFLSFVGIPILYAENTSDDIMYMIDECRSGSISVSELVQAFTGMKDASERMRVSRLILNSAKAQNDCFLSAFGSEMTGFSHLMLTDADSGFFYLKNAISISEKNYLSDTLKYGEILSSSYNYMALYYLNCNPDYSYKAIEHLYGALEYVSEESPNYPLILTNLTLSYYFRNDSTGMQYAKECLDYSEKHGTFIFMSNYCMAMMCYVSKKYDQALYYADKSIDILKKSPNAERFTRELFSAYNIKGKIYISMGKESEAIESLNNALELYSSGITVNITETYLLFADLYYGRGEYLKALEILNNEIDRCRQFDTFLMLNELYRKAAEIYSLVGNYAKAYEYYKVFHELTGEIFNMDKEYSMAELRAKYNLGQYENRLQQQKIAVLKRNRQIMFLSIALAFSTILITLIWIYNVRKDRYYAKIVQQYLEKASLNEQIKELENNNDLTSANKYVSSSLSDIKSNDLYDRLRYVMEHDRAYRDSDLTIEKLAGMLDTNRSYLSRIINEKSGMNFNAYLNKCRIEEAINSIVDTHGQCLLKTLAFDVGFKTTSSFYKAFMKETGIPPSAFREKCMSI